MSAPKPTLEEQITAVATLREFAVMNRYAISLVGVDQAEKAAKAIDVLDNANLFRDLDEADLERETEARAPEPCPVHPDEPDDAGCGEEADAARMTAGLLGIPLTGAQAPEHNIPHDRSRLEE